MENKIIKKARQLLNNYPNKNNRYYLELEKSFNEYNSSDIFDTETRDLYLKYIEQLNSCLVEDRYSNILIGIMGVILCIICSLTVYTANEYNAIAKSLDDNVILSRDNVSIIVKYNNTKDFNAFTYSKDEDRGELEPLSLSVTSKSDDNKSYNIAYLVYIIEDNDNLLQGEAIDRNEFKYSISVNNRDLGVTRMKDADIEAGNKILVYSGSLRTGEIDNIDLRMWLDGKDYMLYKNKRYRFKIDVSGYVV